MKRFALILSLFFVLHFVNSAQVPSNCTMRAGDVNNDGVINLSDSMLLQQLVRNHAVYTDDPYADVNRDGNIDNTDILILQAYLAGRITELPDTSGTWDASLVTTKFGDCNLDGKVTVADLNFLANILAGNIHPNAQQKASCDVQWNGVLNITDLSVLSNWLAGNIPVLPLIPPN